MRILLAEDTDEVRVGLIRYLSRMGFPNVTAVSDGQKAIERLLRGEHFDVLITDFQMPNMDGGELIRTAYLKCIQPKNVILHTSFGEGDNEVQKLRDGGFQFVLVSKPDIPELLKALQRLK